MNSIQSRPSFLHAKTINPFSYSIKCSQNFLSFLDKRRVVIIIGTLPFRLKLMMEGTLFLSVVLFFFLIPAINSAAPSEKETLKEKSGIIGSIFDDGNVPSSMVDNDSNQFRVKRLAITKSPKYIVKKNENMYGVGKVHVVLTDEEASKPKELPRIQESSILKHLVDNVKIEIDSNGTLFDVHNKLSGKNAVDTKALSKALQEPGHLALDSNSPQKVLLSPGILGNKGGPILVTIVIRDYDDCHKGCQRPTTCGRIIVTKRPTTPQGRTSLRSTTKKTTIRTTTKPTTKTTTKTTTKPTTRTTTKTTTKRTTTKTTTKTPTSLPTSPSYSPTQCDNNIFYCWLSSSSGTPPLGTKKTTTTTRPTTRRTTTKTTTTARPTTRRTTTKTTTTTRPTTRRTTTKTTTRTTRRTTTTTPSTTWYGSTACDNNIFYCWLSSSTQTFTAPVPTTKTTRRRRTTHTTRPTTRTTTRRTTTRTTTKPTTRTTRTTIKPTTRTTRTTTKPTTRTTTKTTTTTQPTTSVPSSTICNNNDFYCWFSSSSPTPPVTPLKTTRRRRTTTIRTTTRSTTKPTTRTTTRTTTKPTTRTTTRTTTKPTTRTTTRTTRTTTRRTTTTATTAGPCDPYYSNCGSSTIPSSSMLPADTKKTTMKTTSSRTTKRLRTTSQPQTIMTSLIPCGYYPDDPCNKHHDRDQDDKAPAVINIYLSEEQQKALKKNQRDGEPKFGVEKNRMRPSAEGKPKQAIPIEQKSMTSRPRPPRRAEYLVDEDHQNNDGAAEVDLIQPDNEKSAVLNVFFLWLKRIHQRMQEYTQLSEQILNRKLPELHVDNVLQGFIPSRKEKGNAKRGPDSSVFDDNRDDNDQSEEALGEQQYGGNEAKQKYPNLDQNKDRNRPTKDVEESAENGGDESLENFQWTEQGPSSLNDIQNNETQHIDTPVENFFEQSEKQEGPINEAEVNDNLLDPELLWLEHDDRDPVKELDFAGQDNRGFREEEFLGAKEVFPALVNDNENVQPPMQNPIAVNDEETKPMDLDTANKPGVKSGHI